MGGGRWEGGGGGVPSSSNDCLYVNLAAEEAPSPGTMKLQRTVIFYWKRKQLDCPAPRRGAIVRAATESWPTAAPPSATQLHTKIFIKNNGQFINVIHMKNVMSNEMSKIFIKSAKIQKFQKNVKLKFPKYS